jgi:ribonuclease PH
MLGDGSLVEVQGTGEESTFSRQELDEMLDLAEAGLAQINSIQQKSLSGIE